MGDPKHSRKVVHTPSHPWQRERINVEKEIRRKYGLKNKREIWKVQTQLSDLRRQARFLQSQPAADKEAKLEKEHLFQRLRNLGILHMSDNLRLDDILGLTIESLLARRLQTVVYLKGLANTPQQARQFIVHGHISVNGKRVTIPSYVVKSNEEKNIGYTYSSPINNELHPERPDMESFEEKMKKFREGDKEKDNFRNRRRRFNRGGGSTPKGGKGQPGQGGRTRRRRRRR